MQRTLTVAADPQEADDLDLDQWAAIDASDHLRAAEQIRREVYRSHERGFLCVLRVAPLPPLRVFC